MRTRVLEPRADATQRSGHTIGTATLIQSAVRIPDAVRSAAPASPLVERTPRVKVQGHHTYKYDSLSLLYWLPAVHLYAVHSGNRRATLSVAGHGALRARAAGLSVARSPKDDGAAFVRLLRRWLKLHTHEDLEFRVLVASVKWAETRTILLALSERGC